MNSKINKKVLKEALTPYMEGLSATLPSEEECGEITFSSAFEKRMKGLIQKQKRFCYTWFHFYGKKAAAIFLFTALGLTVTAVGVTAIREPVLGFIVKNHEKYSEITLEDAATDYVEFVKTEPTYIPEGYVARRGKKEGKSCYRKEYKNQAGDTIVYLQETNSGLSMTLDTENSECYKEFTLQSYPAILNINKGHASIILVTEHYLYRVSGKVSEEELLRMMESISLER